MTNKRVTAVSRFRGLFPIIGSLLLGMALRGNDSLHILLEFVYPPEDSVGSISIEMAEISGSLPLKERTDLFLIRHESSSEETVALVRRGSSGTVDHLLAGIPERRGSASVPVGSLNSFSLLDMKVPPKTLIAATVMTPPTAERGHYSIATAKFEKNLVRSGDLIAMTANEMRNMRLLYGLSMVTLFAVGLGVSRFTKLTHPKE